VRPNKEAISLRGKFRRHHDVRDEDIHSDATSGALPATIPLPVEVKPEEAQGSFTNGLLEIRIPKHEASKQKRSYRVPIS
jgi:HSP20 family protein